MPRSSPAHAFRVVQVSPVARVLWRSSRSVALELGTRRVEVSGVDSGTVRRLTDRSGTAGTDTLLYAVDDDSLQGLLLDGFVWPAATSRRPVDGMDERRLAPSHRLHPELAALSVSQGTRAAQLLAERAGRRVAVTGRGALGVSMVAVLAAAGVGHVCLTDASPTRTVHVRPGGALPDDEGRPLDEVAAEAAARAATTVDTAPPSFGETPDLLIVAMDELLDDARRDALHARGCPYLLIASTAARTVVGPLVVPGATSCLRCADLHRLDRDPAWSALAVQLSSPHRPAQGTSAATGLVAAGLATGQALEFLDGGWPATVEGTVEIDSPDWRIRRRSWPAHPDCGCLSGDTDLAGRREPGPLGTMLR